MRRQPPGEHSARVLAVALSTWGIAVAWAAAAGVLARISTSALAGLALFAIVYAPVTYFLDRPLRQFIQAAPGRAIAAAALALDAALAIAAVAMLGEPGAWIAKVSQPAFALAALFAAPIAAVLHLAWLQRVLDARPRVRKEAARSPGASPAST